MSDLIPLHTVPLSAVSMPAQPSFTANDPQRLEEACSELESLFIYYLLKEMRATVPKSGFINGGKTEEMYTSIFDLQLAKEIATERGIGISSILLEQLAAKVDRLEDDNEKSEGKELGSP